MQDQFYWRSSCHGAPMRVGGDGEGEGDTHYYICNECGDPCDPVKN